MENAWHTPNPERDIVEILIDESVASGTYKYHEIPYHRAENLDEIDEAGTSGEPFREQQISLHQILGQNLREQERMRTRFTLALLLVFAVVVAFALTASMTPFWSNANDALLIVLPGITGFVGFAVGFYYLTVLWPTRTR